MISGVAFAGVTGAGKSTLFGLLQERLAADASLSLAVFRNDLIQNPGLRLWRETGSREEILGYLRRSLDLIGELAAFPRALVPLRGGKLTILCESWALNLLAELDLWLPDELAPLDEMRARAGLALVHLRLEPEAVPERSVRSTKEHRGPGWKRYVEAFGAAEEEQVAVFEKRRRLVSRYFALCREPKLEIATAEMDWPRHAEAILRFLADGADAA